MTRHRVFVGIFFACLVLSIRDAAAAGGVYSDERGALRAVWRPVSKLAPPKRPRVILVLGGGGARGLAHIGVLKVFDELHIPVDEVVGVSVGALIGALYASGISPAQIEKMANEVGWEKLTNLSNTRFLKLVLSDNLLSTDKMEKYLQAQIGERTFADLKIPFTCIATDSRTGERVVFQEGSVATAARASATIPGLFQPVEYRHRLLIDGGIVDNLPTDLARERDVDAFVIAVLPQNDANRGEVTTTFGYLIRSIDIQKDVLVDTQKKEADFLLEPNVGTISLINLDRQAECIEAGAVDARVHIEPLMRKYLRRVVEPKALIEEKQ